MTVSQCYQRSVLRNDPIVFVTVLPSSDFTGPSFLLEPPGKYEFSNTTGAWVDCTAAGHPAPHIRWLTADGTPVADVSSLRQDMSNGTLAMLPFPPAMYRQDVHSAVYRCLATNDVGAIVSRDVHIRAGECRGLMTR